jgi:hypothetical protein
MFDYLFYFRMALNVVFKWLAVPLHILEVLGSNLSPEAGNPEGALGFPQFLQGTAGIVP